MALIDISEDTPPPSPISSQMTDWSTVSYSSSSTEGSVGQSSIEVIDLTEDTPPSSPLPTEEPSMEPILIDLAMDTPPSSPAPKEEMALDPYVNPTPSTSSSTLTSTSSNRKRDISEYFDKYQGINFNPVVCLERKF